MPLCHGLARHQKNFKCALQSLRIIGVNALRRFRIHLLQLRVDSGPALRKCSGGDLLPDVRIGTRHGGQAVAQRLEIEHGPANQQRNATASANIRHFTQGILTKERGGIDLRRIEKAQQSMWGKRQRRGIGLARADIHLTVDLRRVDVDDLAGQPSD